MGGGPSTVRLAAAVSNAGALGSLAGGYLSPDQLRSEIRDMRAATSQPYAVNLFVVSDVAADDTVVERALTVLEPYRVELGLPPRPAPLGPPWSQRFEDQFAVVLEERVPVFSFAFGALDPRLVDELHDRGTAVIGTATNVAEAEQLAGSGVDLVCAQGSEAGGHHGSWLAPGERSTIGTMALVPQVCDAVSKPVIAAGGIMDGRGVAAALCLGAGAAQMGTAFLLCDEAGTATPHRTAVAKVAETGVYLTSTVTGRLARGVRNRLMEDLAGVDVPLYPVMNWLTSELRRAAAAQDRADLMSLWCGQAAPLAKPQPAAAVVEQVRRFLADCPGL
jgi:nitronate monooxygenase